MYLVQSFCSSFFQKACREPPAKRRSLSAESEITTGFSFCKAFSFGPFVSKEKALWAENFVCRGDSQRFRRKLVACQAIALGPSRTPVPTGLIVFLKLTPVGEGLAPPDALQSLRHFLAKMPPPFTQGRHFLFSPYYLVLSL